MNKIIKKYKVNLYSDKQNSSFEIEDKDFFEKLWCNREACVFHKPNGGSFGHDLSQFKSMSIEEIEDE